LPLGLLSLAEAWDADVSVWDTDYNPHGESMSFTEKLSMHHMYLDALDGNHIIWDEIAGEIERQAPDVVGLTVLSPKLPSALRVAEIAKDCGVQRVIAGGPHVTLDTKSVLASPAVDACVSGEGEDASQAFLPRVMCLDAA